MLISKCSMELLCYHLLRGQLNEIYNVGSGYIFRQQLLFDIDRQNQYQSSTVKKIKLCCQIKCHFKIVSVVLGIILIYCQFATSINGSHFACCQKRSLWPLLSVEKCVETITLHLYLTTLKPAVHPHYKCSYRTINYQLYESRV